MTGDSHSPTSASGHVGAREQPPRGGDGLGRLADHGLQTCRPKGKNGRASSAAPGKGLGLRRLLAAPPHGLRGQVAGGQQWGLRL